MSQSNPLLVLALFVSAAIAIGLYASLDRAKPRNDIEKPFYSEVRSAKSLCLNEKKKCWQELTFFLDNHSVTLVKRQEPWFEVGDMVELIKVHTEMVGLPGCVRGSVRCTDALTHHYDFAQSHNKDGQ